MKTTHSFALLAAIIALPLSACGPSGEKAAEETKEAADAIGDATSEGVEDAMQAAEKKMDAVGETAEKVGDKTKEVAGDAAKAGGDALETAGDKAQELGDKVKDAAK
jgi:hypothetical protein